MSERSREIPVCDAPPAVVCFVYRRPVHADRMFESLAKNSLNQVSEIIVYCDGPRTTADIDPVSTTREVVAKWSQVLGLKVIHRETNLGLEGSVLRGLDEAFARHPSVIVIEEDLVVSSVFLDYMVSGLRAYRWNHKVASIHGWVMPTHLKLPRTFFLRGADCWGWSTWKDRWVGFERDPVKLQSTLGGKEKWRFNFGWTDRYTNMLDDRVEGRNDSWAILWYASAFLKRQLTLYPGKSLVSNVGNDGSGSHAISTTKFDTKVHDKIPRLPFRVKESLRGRIAFTVFLRGRKSGPLLSIACSAFRKIRAVRKVLDFRFVAQFWR
jgi:hypothetical protein